jgi:hypothetical protein
MSQAAVAHLPRAAAGALKFEPHAAYAEILPSGELLVMTAVQRPFLIASDLGKLLKMPMNKIRGVPARWPTFARSWLMWERRTAGVG